MQYVLFTDNLADLNVADVCAEARRAGFDGLDLTLRTGGHVRPEQAELGLAEARRSADAAGISIPMVTTAITSADSPHAEDTFAAAAHYGVRRLKLGYWRYTPFGALVKQLDQARTMLDSVIKLARRYGVLPCVHVHSGDILSNGGPATYLIIRDFAPADVGAYVDPMHMTAEGGVSGWKMGLDLLAPWIALVGIKNFRFVEDGRDQRGQLRFRTQYTPLADGQAPLPEFIDHLKQLRYDGVVSLHSEYKGRSSFRVLNTRELLIQSAEDLRYLKSLVNAADPLRSKSD
ncbi:MAG: sugar phosphate isomerase/epimerase [Planctomycetes bacterium]|nr:sugar phosphate isomerase/epimerase [Planctomycetota bacterium]